MLKIIIYIALGALIAVLARWGVSQAYSFRAQRPADYAALTPEFDIRATLSGALVAEGVIYDFTGRVNSRFTAEMHGAWDGDAGVLTERFHYDSGRSQAREWRLQMGEDGHFSARAPDVIGVGQGRQMGPAVRMTYRIQLDEAAGGHVLDVTDWLYLLDNGSVVNRSEFRKFGLKVGELVATFRKAD